MIDGQTDNCNPLAHAHHGLIGERSKPLSDKLGGEICIATRALVCIYICVWPDYRVRPDDRTVLTLYVACAARAKRTLKPNPMSFWC